MVSELCDSAIRFQQAGGIKSALPKGATSGRANLRKGSEDLSLFVYGNVEVKDLITTKFGAGIQFEVGHSADLGLLANTCSATLQWQFLQQMVLQVY